MAAYLALKHKETGNVMCGQGLVEVDEIMCKSLQVECDPITFYKEWMDTVGFGLTCGQTFDQLREKFPTRLDVIDWLDTHFENDSYHGR